MKFEEEIIETLHKAIFTELYKETFQVEGISLVSFESVYYSNGNRRVYLKLLGTGYEVYSKKDNELLCKVEARVLYIINQQLHIFKRQLEDILEG